jgi:hypothetical protein
LHHANRGKRDRLEGEGHVEPDEQHAKRNPARDIAWE